MKKVGVYLENDDCADYLPWRVIPTQHIHLDNFSALSSPVLATTRAWMEIYTNRKSLLNNINACRIVSLLYSFLVYYPNIEPTSF